MEPTVKSLTATLVQNSIIFPSTKEDQPLCLVIENILSKEECTAVIDIAKELGFQQIGQYRSMYRKGKRATVTNQLSGWLMEKIKPMCPSTILVNNRVYKLSSVNKEVKILKYDTGDHFLGVHCDDCYTETVNGKLKKSLLTIAIFLNENFIGGHLNFSTFNKKRTHLVRASTGTGALFRQTIPHYAEEVWHVKYLLRADVMYIEK